MRRSMVLAAATTAALMLGAGASQAGPMPAAPIAAPAPAQIELVRGACGFGAHRTYSGYCRLNRGWRGRARAHRAWRRRY